MSQENSREQKVAQVFAQNPELDEIFVTSNDFAWRQKSKAESHAATLKDDKVETFKREKLEEKTGSILELSVKPLTEALNQINEVEALEALKEEEAAMESPRKGALKAIEARIAVLIAAIDVTGAEGVQGTEGTSSAVEGKTPVAAEGVE